MNFQQVLANANEHTIEGVIVGSVVILGKVFDKLQGRKADTDRNDKHAAVVKMLDDHASSDNVAFARIAAGQESILSEIAHVRGLAEDTKEQVEQIKTRELNRLEAQANRSTQ